MSGVVLQMPTGNRTPIACTDVIVDDSSDAYAGRGPSRSREGDISLLVDGVPAGARVAVYWDFENLLISQYKFIHGRQAWDTDGFSTQLRKAKDAPIDLDVVLRYAASLGSVTVNRAYCDWTRPMFRSYGMQLAKVGGEPVQQFAATAAKNGADIRMALDIAEDLTSDDDVTDVLICSGDSDFLALVELVQRGGRRLHAVGVEGSTNGVWAKSCDFHGYNDLAARDAVALGAPSETADDIVAVLRRLPDGQWVQTDALPCLLRRGNWALDAASLQPDRLAAAIAAAVGQGLIEAAGAGQPTRVRIAASVPLAESASDEVDAVATRVGRWPQVEQAARRARPHVRSAATWARNRWETWWYRQ